MENDKKILDGARRLRNIKGCIIAEVDKGRRVEINPEIIKEFINSLKENTSNELDVKDISKLLFIAELLNLLTIDGYNLKLQ